MNWWQQPFIQIALPIMITFVLSIWLATWTQNKSFGQLGKRIDDFRADVNARFLSIENRLARIESRLDSIDAKLSEHGERITRVEERLSLVRR
jgi:hypothetical protein